MPVRRRSREFWERLVAEAAQDTIASTAKRHHVRPSTLKWWRWHLAKKPGADSTPGKEPTLLPVVFSTPEVTVAPAAQTLTLEFAAGIKIRVPIGADARYVAALVAAIRSSC